MQESDFDQLRKLAMKVVESFNASVQALNLVMKTSTAIISEFGKALSRNFGLNMDQYLSDALLRMERKERNRKRYQRRYARHRK